MRVITGSARGRRLDTLEGDKITRPTSEKVKEALFSMIQFELEGRRVLDLFAGSGQLGIEALSRGAEFASFVDVNKSAAEVIKSNVERCGFKDRAEVRNTDFMSFISRSREKFDIAFIDPPYHTGLLQKAAEAIPCVMSDYGIIVCEHASDEILPEKTGCFILKKSRSYGKLVTLSIYMRGDAEF